MVDLVEHADKACPPKTSFRGVAEEENNKKLSLKVTNSIDKTNHIVKY